MHDALLLKLIVANIPVVLFLLGLAFFWQRIKRNAKIVVIVVMGTGMLLQVPLWRFSFALRNILAVVDTNCPETISLCEDYLQYPYNPLGSTFIGKLIGYRPKHYFLGTLAICEYREGNMAKAAQALEQLLVYGHKFPVEQELRETQVQLLNQSRNHLIKDETSGVK